MHSSQKTIQQSLCVLLLSICVLPAQAAPWQAILISGDDSIDNFDASREKIGQLLQQRGLTQQQHLHSQWPDAMYPKEQSATLFNVARSFTRLSKGADGCVFYLSSHGKADEGVYLKRAHEQVLTPSQLNVALNRSCQDKPTVVLISACYSGQFVNTLKTPNRIILTAASATRPSFGCSEDTTYTFWDGCLIDNLPKSQTWRELSDATTSCITRKEQQLHYPASLPQAFFGENVAQLPIAF